MQKVSSKAASKSTTKSPVAVKLHDASKKRERLMLDHIAKGKKIFIGLEDSLKTWKLCVRSGGLIIHETSLEANYLILKRYFNNYPDCELSQNLGQLKMPSDDGKNYLCRIEPENNVRLVLDAFACQTELSLVVVGNWKQSDYGLSLLEQYTGFFHIHLWSSIYDSEKINFLRSNAFVYVHGHSAGGTNPSLVEAMTLGLPVFAFDCVYNRHTTENQCVYWSDASELHACITQCEKTRLDDIGKNMKLIADNRYTWNTIVSKYESLYK